jgi:hypothetical protein
LLLFANDKYVKNVFRVLKPGGVASLFFSNTERRGGKGLDPDPSTDPTTNIMWCDNYWSLTAEILRIHGFVDIKDLMPTHVNTMAYARKPFVIDSSNSEATNDKHAE